MRKHSSGSIFPPGGILATFYRLGFQEGAVRVYLPAGARGSLRSGSGLAWKLRAGSCLRQGRAARVSASLRCSEVRLLPSNSRTARHLLINSVAPLSERKSQV